MKKAFTLIELLAVIVILAILALIVSPIISGVISDVKKASTERSIEGYIKAIEYAQVQYQYRNDGSITKNIDKLSISAKQIDKIIINNIKFNNSGLVSRAKLLIDEYVCNYTKVKTICKIPISLNKELIYTLKNDEDSGLVIDSNEPERYIFKGKDPKNKIILQESTGPTLYRIVSFEKDNTIKVVREDKIDLIKWDNPLNRNSTTDTYCNLKSSYGCNAWGNMLNTYRENKIMDDYFSLRYYFSNSSKTMSVNGSEDVPKTVVTRDSSLNKYLNTIYLETNLLPIKNYLDEHMWDVGGIAYVSNKSKDFKKEIEETEVNKWSGYIALFSIIDYINASDNDTYCTNLFSNFGSTSNSPCTISSDGNENNYLYKSEFNQWTLNPKANVLSGVMFVSSSGFFQTSSSSTSYAVRPSFYLNSDVKLVGEGTDGHEFTIVEK